MIRKGKMEHVSTLGMNRGKRRRGRWNGKMTVGIAKWLHNVNAENHKRIRVKEVAKTARHGTRS